MNTSELENFHCHLICIQEAQAFTPATGEFRNNATKRFGVLNNILWYFKIISAELDILKLKIEQTE